MEVRSPDGQQVRELCACARLCSLQVVVHGLLLRFSRRLARAHRARDFTQKRLQAAPLQVVTHQPLRLPTPKSSPDQY
jgi:hypothetical protein